MNLQPNRTLALASHCWIMNPLSVRGALLAKGPDSSLGEVHRGSCSEDIHMEEEKIEVKVQEHEVEYERDCEECKVEIEERTDNHSGA